MSEYQYYEFNRRLQELAGPSVRPQAAAARRTWAELRETAGRLRQEEERRQQAEAEARRIKDLQDFAPRAAQAWRDVQALIEEKKARPYDEAMALLVKLRDLAVFQNRLAEFQTRLAALQAQHANRPAFQERLRKARLV
jgi:predicted nucleic acid-binding protein